MHDALQEDVEQQVIVDTIDESQLSCESKVKMCRTLNTATIVLS